jgi:PAS domain S-box-containing protein
MVVLWGPELIQIYNDGYLALMGAKHPAGLGQPTQECWPEVWHINEPIYARVWQGETLTFEDQLYPITRRGFLEDAYFTLCYSPLRDQAQTIAGIVVTVFETTGRIEAANEQRRTEVAFRHSEERLRAAQDAGQMASWEWDFETGNLLWSGSVERVYGRLPEAVTPVSRILEYLHPEDRETVMENVQRAIDNGNEFDHEFRVFWPDGSLHWIAGRGRAVPSPDGRSLRMIGVNWNITARKAAEEKLQTERLRLVELFQQAPAFIAVVRGPQHIFEMTNRSYRELVGNRDLIGRSIVEALPEAEEQGFVALLDRVYETGEVHVAQAALISLVRTPGELPEQRYLDYVYQPMREVDGSTSGVIALGVDVTERRRAEEALMQSEKLAAIGRLASSIAHEINNPLESVTNLLYLARGSSHLSEIQGYLDMAERELRRVSNITNQTLRFYRQSTDPTAVFSEKLIAETVAIYQGRILNSRIEVQVRIRGREPVTCFEGEIRQVLSNLVGNAIDAMHPMGGSLLLRSREATHWKTGRRGVVITVADTGAGMARPVIKKIFDAFFSTKGTRGNGLGLWISCEIVDRHHGSLRVYSSQRKGHSGTVFTVFLPFETASREGAAQLQA